MLSVKPLSSLNAEDLKKIIPHLSFLKYDSSEISQHSDYLISLLAQLNAKHTYKFIKTIDDLYPGMSFHYVMEARNQKENEDYQLFLFRITYHLFAFPEKDLFSPMRKRLITGLLFDHTNDSLFTELKTTLIHIENLVSLTKKQKKLIKKNISNSFFEHFSTSVSQEIDDPTLD